MLTRFQPILLLAFFSNLATAADPLTITITGANDNAARVGIMPLNPGVSLDVKSIVPPGSTIRKTSRGVEYIYVDGQLDIDVVAQPVRLVITQGIESIPQSLTVSSRQSKLSVNVPAWIDMSARSWYSGDSHIHINTGGPIKATIKDALLAGRAEGLNYLNLCVSNNLGDDLRDADKVKGVVEPESTNRVILSYGEEMRSSIYGHMQFFGIKKVVLPQYTGFDNTPNHLDYPCNYTLASEAADQGGVVTYGHPMLKNSPDAFATKLTEANGAARELPIDAALGKVHAIDLMSYNCDKHLSADLWYRLLNCGLKLSACVGTDALLDQSTDPAGGARVYAYVPGGLTSERWLDALRNGRTFVTNGPMLDLKVGDHMPGDTLKLDAPQSLPVGLRLDSSVVIDKLEMIVNGQVVKTIEVGKKSDMPISASMTFDVPVDRSCWVAVRTSGPDHESLFDGPAWAHSSPVYIEVAGQPVRVTEDRAYFVQWIEKLIQVVQTRNRYPNDAARDEVVGLFRRAQEFYR